MTKENWKTLNRNQRITARKLGAATYRITRKAIRALSPERYAARMGMLETIHAEIAPQMIQLAKAQQALDDLSLA